MGEGEPAAVGSMGNGSNRIKRFDTTCSLFSLENAFLCKTGLNSVAAFQESQVFGPHQPGFRLPLAACPKS